MQRAVIREKYQQPIKVREIHVNAERPSPGSVANFDLLIPAHIVGSSLNILALSRILLSASEDRWDFRYRGPILKWRPQNTGFWTPPI